MGAPRVPPLNPSESIVLWVCSPVQIGSHARGLGDIGAVHEPEPSGDGGGEGDGVVDEGEGGGPRHVLPLGAGGPSWVYLEIIL